METHKILIHRSQNLGLALQAAAMDALGASEKQQMEAIKTQELSWSVNVLRVQALGEIAVLESHMGEARAGHKVRNAKLGRRGSDRGGAAGRFGLPTGHIGRELWQVLCLGVLVLCMCVSIPGSVNLQESSSKEATRSRAAGLA